MTSWKWGNSPWWYYIPKKLEKTYTFRSGMGVLELMGRWYVNDNTCEFKGYTDSGYTDAAQKDALQFSKFRFYLTNETRVIALDDSYTVSVGCGKEIRLVVWGDNDKEAMGGKYRYTGPGVFYLGRWKISNCEPLCGSGFPENLGDLLNEC